MFSDIEELNYKLLCEGKNKEKQVQVAKTKRKLYFVLISCFLVIFIYFSMIVTPPSTKAQLFPEQETMLKQEINQSMTQVEPIVKFPDFKSEVEEEQVDRLVENANILIRTTESFRYEIQEMELPQAVILKSGSGYSKEAEINSSKARKSYKKLLKLLNKKNS